MLIDSTFWENEKRRLLAIFLPRLTQMAMAGMTNAARQAGIAFDNTLYSKLAENWARTQTDNLLIELGTTTEKFVGDKVADWIAKPDMTVGDLDAALTPAFGATRANAIAVTETTRAFASGQEEAYKAEGITEWIWRTNKDEMVCKYCGGANNKVVKIGEPFGTDRKGKPVTKPPFHPRCRCWVAPKISKDKPKEQGKHVSQTVAETKPLPQALGADAAKEAVLKTQLFNELVSMSISKRKKLLEKVFTPNLIPKVNYHSKWFASVETTDAQEYQIKFEKFLASKKFRIFSGIKNNEKIWYFVDLQDGYFSAYNESRSQHYTFSRREKIEQHLSFLRDNTHWLVEIKQVEDSFEVLDLWNP